MRCVTSEAQPPGRVSTCPGGAALLTLPLEKLNQPLPEFVMHVDEVSASLSAAHCGDVALDAAFLGDRSVLEPNVVHGAEQLCGVGRQELTGCVEGVDFLLTDGVREHERVELVLI